MEMINRLTADALDSRRFVDRINELVKQEQEVVLMEMHGRRGTDAPSLAYPQYENRTQRRARERAEAKAARKAQA